MVRKSEDDAQMTYPKRPPGDADAKFARDAWLRALAKTSTIADQGVILPVLIDRLAGEFDAAPALVAVQPTNGLQAWLARLR